MFAGLKSGTDEDRQNDPEPLPPVFAVVLFVLWIAVLHKQKDSKHKLTKIALFELVPRNAVSHFTR